MLTVTEDAKKELGRILASAEVEDAEVGLRLVLGDSGELRLALDKEKEGDQVVEHESVKILLVGNELSGILEGVTVDCQETTEGTHLFMGKQ